MTLQQRQASTAPLPSVDATTIRPEIQALRAIAVLGVVVFHLWPHRLPGGYVGVDVFFVVSGFLITDHLVREISRSGTISLPRFWARRARRLLPASLLVLSLSAVAIWLFTPDIRWAQFGGEIISSIFYVENWALAAQSVDYMALTNAKSPVQHFWSLGVEEQFYVVWPLLLIIALLFAKRRGIDLRRIIAATIIAVTIASFAYSVWETAKAPSAAYFSTFTRAWEFGVGGALALLLQHRRSPFGMLGRWMAWAGLAALAVSMLIFTGQTPFPSYTALLPVLATTVVIAAGLLWASVPRRLCTA